ncbi:hypothetical protein SAMN02799616_02352 [Paenibacillus sp. UNC499MF]|nr:hypothetical protein SAMN02799616_02352 [Paenibacillus sp. UNC499MF]
MLPEREKVSPFQACETIIFAQQKVDEASVLPVQSWVIRKRHFLVTVVYLMTNGCTTGSTLFPDGGYILR